MRAAEVAKDFLSLDKSKYIGYNSKVKLGKTSGPCRKRYAEELFFPAPYSPFSLLYLYHCLAGTRYGNATARPNPLSESVNRDDKLAKEQPTQRTKSFSFSGEATKNSSKLNEQYANVYENKGPLW